VTFARTERAIPGQRRVISEEVHWRTQRAGPAWKRLYEAECQPPAWLRNKDRRLENVLEPGLVAAIYRSLRKGREDAKDEPGAADFYYGEMEMRRYDQAAPLSERSILWLYWLVSGYGLRASRALTALLVTLLIFTGLLRIWGFEDSRSFGGSLLFSVNSSISLLRPGTDESEPLTAAGEVLATALRLLGPLLFGLMLLSLRGRVKR
jgi:hypothetical protein